MYSMNKNSITLIWKVESVTWVTLSIKLDENIHSSLPIIEWALYRIGQIGSFIKIPLGYSFLYWIITQAWSDAIPEWLIQNEAIKGSRWVRASLIWERVWRVFERWILQFPIADDEVHLVTQDDLKLIYWWFDELKSIIVWQVSASENLIARVDIDKLINRHCAILWSTWSWKSNTVSIILEAIATRKNKEWFDFKSTRVLLIDPHGEYWESLKEHSQIFKVWANSENHEKELIIPFWALSFKELISTFPWKLNEKQEEYIREKVLQKKIEAAKFLTIPPDLEALTADSPIPFSINQLWFELIDIEQKTFEDRDLSKDTLFEEWNPEKLIANKYLLASTLNSAPYSNARASQWILSFLTLMKNRLLDQRFKFLFDLGRLTPWLDWKIETDIDTIIKEWIWTEKPITILDLSSIPSEIMSSISGSLISIIYEFLYWWQKFDVWWRNTPILFALEEAHSYLKSGENSIASRIVQKIAKEGRKYGSWLLLITQRPSELDETVLSQCWSIIALRMTNSKDRGHIKSSVEDSLWEIIELLPSLRTWEWLIMWECVKLPMRTSFTKAKQSKSNDPLVSENWKIILPEDENYRIVVKNWRNNKIL